MHCSSRVWETPALRSRSAPSREGHPGWVEWGPPRAADPALLGTRGAARWALTSVPIVVTSERTFRYSVLDKYGWDVTASAGTVIELFSRVGPTWECERRAGLPRGRRPTGYERGSIAVSKRRTVIMTLASARPKRNSIMPANSVLSREVNSLDDGLAAERRQPLASSAA
jgi:hypothetical protein